MIYYRRNDMGILDELKELEEKDIIIDLRKEKLPLVMWGAGSSAPEVKYYLKKHGIIISDVFVDDEYYTENLMFNDKSVISYSMLKEKYDKVNVILGNSYYEKKEILEKRSAIEHVFCLFSISYNIFEKTPLTEIEQYITEFESVYELLEDDKSKKNLLAFLKTRVSGNNKYIIDIFEKETNFFHNNIFKIGRDEIYLDVGAFDGDTIRLFLKENDGYYKYIYALEPDENNYNKLENFVNKNLLKDIQLKKVGAWNQKKELFFSSENQVSGVVEENKVVTSDILYKVLVAPLDDMFDYKDNVTIVKINYLEGVKEAVEGAKNILKNQTPKLAITLGFDCRNIRSIPLLVKKINPEYKIYLCFNRGMASGLTLYGVI